MKRRRPQPARCMACQESAGVIWRGKTLLCAACDAASAPVGKPTPAELEQAIGRVVTAHGAIEIARKR